MKAGLVRIGNSRGVRIPKPLIEQCGLGETVDLRVENDCLVISPKRLARQGWDEAFRAAALPLDNDLLLDLGSNEFDGKEWKW